jgi:hypothetical protein
MPVNYLEIQEQINQFCENARQRVEALQSLHAAAEVILHSPGMDVNRVHELVAAEIRTNPNLRCAIPVEMPFDRIYPPPANVVLTPVLAADGSQIIPSRHRQVEFGAINIAALSMTPGSGLAPRKVVHSKLLDNSDLSDNGDPLSEGYIALLRDVSERQLLLETAAEFNIPVVALTDGGLELFREPRASSEYDRVLAEYVQLLRQMSFTNIIPAGYVDKPGSSLVTGMLEIIGKQNDPEFHLAGLVDRLLFSNLLTTPGSRSVLFGIQSPQAKTFSGKLAVHFFYINVGRMGAAKIARVEIPGWVAENPSAIDNLHATLLDQCQMSGSAYPYLLHRAHEEAVIQFEDSARLEEILAARLLDLQLFPGEKSAKQSMKDLPGKKRERR